MQARYSTRHEWGPHTGCCCHSRAVFGLPAGAPHPHPGSHSRPPPPRPQARRSPPPRMHRCADPWPRLGAVKSRPLNRGERCGGRMRLTGPAGPGVCGAGRPRGCQSRTQAEPGPCPHAGRGRTLAPPRPCPRSMSLRRLSPCPCPCTGRARVLTQAEAVSCVPVPV